MGLKFNWPEAVSSSVANWLYGLSSVDRVAEPVVHQPAALVSLIEQTHPEQVAETRGPNLGEFGTLDQIDRSACARLSGSCDCRNSARLFQRRQQPDRVEIDAPQEFGVRGERRGHDVQPAKLREDQVIDEIVARRCGIVLSSAAVSTTAIRAAMALPSVRTMMAVSPARQRVISPAGLTSTTDSSLGGVLHLPREVFGRAVRVGPGDLKLPLRADPDKGDLPGRHFEGLQARRPGAVIRDAPLRIQSRIALYSSEPDLKRSPPPCGTLERRFQQNQALGRIVRSMRRPVLRLSRWPGNPVRARSRTGRA